MASCPRAYYPPSPLYSRYLYCVVYDKRKQKRWLPTRVAGWRRLLLFRLLLFICKSPLSQADAERKGLYIHGEADEIKVALSCIMLDGYGQYTDIFYRAVCLCVLIKNLLMNA